MALGDRSDDAAGDGTTEAGTDGRRGGPPAVIDVRAPDPADLSGIVGALDRLGPALDAFVDWSARLPAPAYVPGQVTSEPAPLPEDGVGLERVLEELAQAVASGCRISAPGFWGFITTGATTAPAAAGAAVAVAGGQRHLLHAFNALEVTGLRWLADLCRIPPESTGVFASGGSTANLIALGAARQSAYEQRGVDVAAHGMGDGSLARVYASAQAHRTIHRAAAVLGLGRDAVVSVPTDREGRIDVAALDATVAADVRGGLVPVAVVGIAGTTDTGAVDPLDDVLAVARRYGTWFHVDGAYGLIAAASPRLAARFDGMAGADSWIVDPHKWLATGVGVGATYVRDGELLARAFQEGEAPYLEGTFGEAADARSQFDSFGGPWADLGVELSSPPRGALVWSVLREIGRRGVADRVERHVAFAAHVAARVRADPRLELLAEPQLSIVCFRYRFPGADADRLNAALLERLRRETPYAPSSTVVDGRLAIRACFINPRTALADVDGLVDAVLDLGGSPG